MITRLPEVKCEVMLGKLQWRETAKQARFCSPTFSFFVIALQSLDLLYCFNLPVICLSC